MAKDAAEVQVGATWEEVLVEDLTRTQLVQYAGASGDYNPMHTDTEFVTKVAGFPSVFAHGMLTMGLTGRALTNWAGAGRIRSYGVRFAKQVWPGDTLTAKLKLEAVREEGGEHLADISVTTVNQNGEDVIRGQATVRLDP